LQALFRYEVFKMLKAEGRINDAVIENMLCWRHSGFNVYCGPTIETELTYDTTYSQLPPIDYWTQ